MLLEIQSREIFDLFLDHLSTEYHRAEDDWYLWGAIDENFDHYGMELNQAPYFWDSARRAFQDSVILRLGRLFDSTAGALSLGNLLGTIQRHAKNQTLSSLSLDVFDLDLAELKKDLDLMSKDEPLLKALRRIRNAYSSHREAKLVASGTFNSLPPLSASDIRALLDRAATLLGKYCRMYGRPILSTKFPGRDDYKRMLTLLRKGLEHARG